MFSDYCVIFDMDGVLADTGPIHYESWVKMAAEIGVEFTREIFNETFGQQSPTITRKLVGPELEEVLVEKWANLKEQYYREMIREKLKPLPGAIRIIKDLKSAGFKLAIGSSGPPENVELLLSQLKIKPFFDTIITADDVNKGKPEPEVFLHAAKNLNIKPENCVVIEDAPVGIKAAKRAGMMSIALTTTHNKQQLFGAQIIIKDLTEINIEDIKSLFDKNNDC
ncbi:MAG: HAD family hydrolase [Promethearchaeota archaeon]